MPHHLPHHWQLAKEFPARLRKFFSVSELSDIELQLLFNRGIKTKQQISEFLFANFERHVFDPNLLIDMSKAKKRILRAMKKQEPICVFGDFDSDGVCASVILKKTFDVLQVPVNVYLPDREKENHGLRKESIAHLAELGTKLIITVDCGISNTAEVAYANERGVDVIVTDHHDIPQELPRAVALVNPKRKESAYPCRELCGTGVAYKLAQLLVRESSAPKKQQESFLKWLLDLVAIGTIGDLVPLRSENRTLVAYGLIVLNKTKRPGIQALLNVAGKSRGHLTSTDVAFSLVPRINVAGRLHHARIAFQLLSTDDPHEATMLATQLQELNIKRQLLSDTIAREAKMKIQQLPPDTRVLWAVGGSSWLAGINGLVASRMVEEFHRPVIMMQQREHETVASGRSIPEFDITEAISQAKHLLTRFGGHRGACGFALENKQREKFFSIVEEFAQRVLRLEELEPKLHIDAILEPHHIHWDLLKSVEKFQPFGQENHEPLFLCRNVSIHDIRMIGKKSEHAKLVLDINHKRMNAILFHGALQFRHMRVGDSIDIVFRMRVNEWNGQRNLELEIIDGEISSRDDTHDAKNISPHAYAYE